MAASTNIIPMMFTSKPVLFDGFSPIKKQILCFLILLTLVDGIKAQNNSLLFDGVNDYVDCGKSPLLSARAIKTIECWARFNVIPFQCELLSNSSLDQGIELVILNNSLSFYCMKDDHNFSHIDYPVSSFYTNVWYHLAASWDGIHKESMKLYVNGTPVGAAIHIGNINSGITEPFSGSFRLGDWSYQSISRSFPGQLDEVRIWSIVRSPANIKNGIYGAVQANTRGLTAYYKLNEAKGKRIINCTSKPGLNGILHNGVEWLASPVQEKPNALSFDGIDDYVIIPAIPAYDFTSGTIECRIKPASLTGVNDCFIASKGVAGRRYSFHVNQWGIVFNNGFSSQSVDVLLSTDTSFHIALVAREEMIDVYIEGILKGSFTKGFGPIKGQPVLLGCADPFTLNGENFEGTLDEVRLWNTKRSAAEIIANKNKKLTGSEPGLIALFSFDQGIASGNNEGLSILIDKTAANNNGMLVNFALSGTSSNYITSLLNP